MKKNKQSKIISHVQKIRTKNNINWMDLLRLAYKLDPKSASKIMRKINLNDDKISKLLKKL
tara:strand:+ start:502 stop:684 length:183 start_codon:yes stop_codon:yes gene_type:complete